MGRPRKPTYLKILENTYRKDRDKPPSWGNLPPLEGGPPDWLSPDGRQAWREWVPLLREAGILTELDRGAFTILCALEGQLRGTYRAGETPRAPLLTAYRLLLAEFGCTPSSRGRVQPQWNGGTPGEGNPWLRLQTDRKDGQNEDA